MQRRVAASHTNLSLVWAYRQRARAVDMHLHGPLHVAGRRQAMPKTCPQRHQSLRSSRHAC